MRIVVNDYSGHAFPVELSREFARRGHQVLHLYFADFQTPKGDLVRSPGDPESFAIQGLTLGEPFLKYNFVRRRGQEIRYAHLVRAQLSAFRPDIVIGCNNPLDAQNRIQAFCRRREIPFVFWLQDIYSSAIKSILGAKIPVLGRWIGLAYERLEKQMLRRASHIVVITDQFLSPLKAWGVDLGRVSVIENWSPKDKIQPGPRNGPWRSAQGFADDKLVLYTGTLGLKHNPDLILATARKLAQRVDAVKIAVAAEGPQSDYIARVAASEGLSHLKVLPFQPFERYSEVLAAADVLIAMIEPDAAAYSVPSKVLSYHCSGRAIVLSAAKSNLAAAIIDRAGSGLVAVPGDTEGFVNAVERLLDDADLRSACAASARAYAEAKFDVVAIADRYAALLAACLTSPGAPARDERPASAMSSPAGPSGM